MSATETPKPFFEAHGVQVFHGDCLRLLPRLGWVFDAVVTDPPYSSGGAFRADRTANVLSKYVQDEYQGRYQPFSGDNRDQRGFYRWCLEWLSELHEVAAPGCVLLTFTDWRQLPLMTDVIQGAGWVWRGIMPWDKTQASRPQRGFYRSQCEFILSAVAGTLGSNYDREADHCAPGIFRHAVNGKDKHHPTGKPTALMRDLLRILPAGSRVLDVFGGSGTTAVAAAELGLQCTVIEKDLHHCEVIRQRLEAVQPGLI